MPEPQDQLDEAFAGYMKLVDENKSPQEIWNEYMKKQRVENAETVLNSQQELFAEIRPHHESATNKLTTYFFTTNGAAALAVLAYLGTGDETLSIPFLTIALIAFLIGLGHTGLQLIKSYEDWDKLAKAIQDSIDWARALIAGQEAPMPESIQKTVAEVQLDEKTLNNATDRHERLKRLIPFYAFGVGILFGVISAIAAPIWEFTQALCAAITSRL